MELSSHSINLVLNLDRLFLMSSFFVKFHYNQAIKKVQISKEQLNWDHVCDILTKSFYLAEKDKIFLKYKDLEDDEITVNSDEDLAEAFNLYFMKNLIKFFVCYSGVFGKHQSEGQFTGYSKIQRPKSFALTSPESLKDSGLRKASEGSQSEEKIVPKKEKYNVKVDSHELQDIFSEVFQNTEVLKRIQDKLSGYISKENKEKSGDLVEYSIETDYKAITDYMVGTLATIMNQKVNDNQVKSIGSLQEEEKVDNKDRSNSVGNNKGLLDNIPLGESIFEASAKSDPIYSSYKSNSGSFRSVECKNLASTLGVKLVLQYEDGKARFVSIPISQDYSIIEREPEVAVKQSVNYEKIEEKEEDIEEPAFNVHLKVKKTASVEKKHYEFENQMLKANVHDLDDDLPAPYDKNLIQKYEKGLTGSVYEKIE